MKRINVCVCVLGLGLAGMASAQPPSEQQQQPSDQQQGAQDRSGMKPSESMLQAQKTSASATVMKVDKANRQLTLKTDDGKTLTMSVPAGVKRLDEIKVGDHINVDYYEAIALSLTKPGAPAPKGGEETRIMRGNGKLPNGVIAKKVTGMVTVVNVDTSSNMLTVRRPNGDMETIHVTDPALQSQLAKIKEGDKIRATYTQAAVVTVTREGGGSAGTSPSGGENKPGENKPSENPSGGAGSDKGM